MPLSTEQIEKLATLFQSKQEADHNMAQSLVESLCKTQDDFESLFLRHKLNLNEEMTRCFGWSIVWAYGFYGQFEDSPLREWETIDFRGFKLKSLPDYLLTWANLKRVYWDAGEIHQLEWLDTTGEDASKWVEILEIGNLRELSLSGLTSLPSSIVNLKNLIELDLSRSLSLRFQEIQLKLPPKLSICKLYGWMYHRFEWVDATGENVTKWVELPEDGSTLYLEDQELTDVPSIVGNFKNLAELYLYSNQLTTLPDWIENLTNLTLLDVKYNPLESIPNNLVALDLDSEQWKRFQHQISNMTALKSLSVERNEFTTLPESIGSLTNYTNLTNLTTLSWSALELTTFPEWIENFTNLTGLAVASNPLTTLPDWIGNLTNLTWLDLSWNQLTCLPESIGNLTHLTELYLFGNQLTTLPESIRNLTKLELLYISENPISESEQARIKALLPPYCGEDLSDCFIS